MIFDFKDVFDTVWGNDATGGKEEIVTASIRSCGETDGTDDDAAEIWASYGLTARPAAQDGEKKCQAISVDVAGKRVIIATRDTRGADNHGALNAGDVALWSCGGNSVRCNADGSMAIHQIASDANGNQDAGMSVEKDGTLLWFNQYGQVELGANGFQAFTKTGEALQVGGGSVNLVASMCAIQCGTVALGVGAAVPLAVAPILAPGGTGFSCSKPTPNIFV